eukprot:TRINITY_DN13527_c0_g3_i1.p1 TRINITY_DN13527_c0_g3~~TRINITY_DN13527_c0_g3_i1.p1  ORF type:complete len:440 (+),score=127.78 TRINITY_DN13527_c0_g3_i1:127-1320(+)
MERLQALVARLVLRRVKDAVALGLPPKEEVVVSLAFDAEEDAFYRTLSETMRERFRTLLRLGVVNKNRSIVLEMLLRLRQACDHPSLVINGMSRASAAMSDSDQLLAFTRKLGRGALAGGFRARLADKLDQVRLDGTSLSQLKQNSTLNELFAGEAAPTCLVCLDPVDTDDPALLPCGHLFCYACAQQAVFKHAKCPSCRAPCNNLEIYRPLGPAGDAAKQSESELPSTKLRKITEDVGALPAGEKAVVFSQFTSMLNMIEGALRRAGTTYARLDGSMNFAKRNAAVHALRSDPQCRCILVSLHAGGVGLNLAAANHVFLVDPWWNPAAEAQAMARVHRFGQSRPVTATRYVIGGTVEERLLAVQASKRSLSEGVLGNGDFKASTLTIEDLKSLFAV